MGRGSSRGSCGIPTSRPSDREVVAKREAMQRPNKRLKLTGGDRFSGSGVLCAGAHKLSFNDGSLAGESPAA
jgi:hypothetical protein